MSAGDNLFLVTVSLLPATIVWFAFYLLKRFLRRKLPLTVRAALITTLVVTGLLTVFVLVLENGVSFGGFAYFAWFILATPIVLGVFILTWAIVTVWKYETQTEDTIDRVGMKSRVFAMLLLGAVGITVLGYVYQERQCSIAGNYATSPEKLREMYNSLYARLDDNIHLRLAYNIATPPDILQALAEQDNQIIRQRVCYNTSASESTLAMLARDKNVYVRACVTRNKNASLQLLSQLADDPDVYVRKSAAYNKNLPPEVMHRLSRDDDSQVRQALAQNKKITAEIINMLIDDENKSVRFYLASNPALPASTQLILARDEQVSVRLNIVNRPDVSKAALVQLVEDPDENIRNRALRRLADIDRAN